MVTRHATRATTRTDDEIRRDVEAELQWEPRVHASEIRVAAHDGVVTLTGRVDAYAKRWAAEEAAHRVRGVRALANDVDVRLPGTMERSDAEIAAAAVHGLEWDALVPVQRLEVTVSKGWVTLRGEVEWQHQRQDAERVVRRLHGLRGVSNLIAVKPRLSPAELKSKIEQALERIVGIDPRDVEVEVDGGRVVLRGTVRSWPERDEAERAAWSAPGIVALEDRITIAP